ncbi:MAG: phosphoenolpyruvate--protein phosphotransferase, partial [Pyrinomonadaceae bacterium]
MILEDASLLTKIEETIVNDRVNAEWAVKVVTDSYISKFKGIADEHLRSRYVDIEDVAERMLTALGGGRNSRLKLEKNSIIVAKEINPSTLIELGSSEPHGLITEHGGWTSHTFILAREINVPAITGIRRVLRRVQTGETVIVDGLRGQMILNPSADSLLEYQSAANELRVRERSGSSMENVAAKTLDGREIVIRANVDFPYAYKVARQQGARGIGLYRSEFLFNQFRGFPSEAEQIDAYSKIADMAGDDGVKIRTFDLSADQLTDQNFEKEKNPALGLRAIRLSLAYPKQFRTQLRSILVASNDRKIDIVLPMISDVSEIRQARQMLDDEHEYLKKRGIGSGSPRLGAMIEIPGAVFVADEIAAEVDFLCLGTNDLVQYLLAVDRDNESVADWFQTLHPAVVRAVRMTLQAAVKKGIPVIVCGEMAGSPFYTPLLIGLGATEFSMNINSIARVRTVITGIAHEETIDVAKQIEKCETAADSLRVMREAISRSWAHLIPPDPANATRKRDL